ncbi:MAG: DNA polymerase IV [Clostridia bacterium]
MERIILHCDINNCYASIECAENPALCGKPVAVCGDVEERHGIVLAKNSEAKAYGVQTGEAVWQAKLKCPSLMIRRPRFDLYLKYSKAVRDIYSRFTNQIESFGIDECWLDVTGSTKLFGSAIEIANKIRTAVSSELGITISVGVSFNKVFAKLASDLKKPDAVTCIEKKLFKKIVWPLPVSHLMGVGRRTAKVLDSLYIKTIGDLAKEPPEHLRKVLGKNGVQLWNYANGLENSPVTDCDFSSPVKSIGHGITTPSDLKHNSEVWHVIFALSETIGKKLRCNRLAASGIQISIRDNEFKTQEFQCMLPAPTQSSLAVSRQAFCLFSKKYAWTHDIRSVSVRAINLVPYGTPYQLDLWGEARKVDKAEKIESTMDKLQDRFGSKIINYAVILYDSRHYSFCENSFH